MPDRTPETAVALRDWLRELKEHSGASFPEIARGTGESERNLKRWMTATGTPIVPAGDTLLKLLDYLGVTFSPPVPGELLSLMGEIREIHASLRRLEAGGKKARDQMLPDLDRRLEELTVGVAEALELLRPHGVIPRARDGSA